MELKIHPKKIIQILSVGALTLGLLNLLACIPFLFFGRKYPWAPLNLDAEHNLPTVFSIALLAFCSLLVGLIAWTERGKRPVFLQWMGLSLAFAFVGMDEAIMIHERLEEPMHAMMDIGGFFHFLWVIPYLVLVILFVGLYWRFYFRLPKDTRSFVLLAAILYVGGSIGLEMLNGAWKELHGRTAVYYLLTTMEELLEMFGVIVFIYAFSNHIDKHLPDFSLRITSS